VGPGALTRALLAGLAAVFAAPVVAQPATGNLTFEAVQAGARFTGRFASFVAEVDFDPTRPSSCRFDVAIDTRSADTGESERDGLLASEDFFWSERHPKALYEGEGCRAVKGGFIVDGQLTLRGVTRPVAVSFTHEPRAAGWRLAGEAVLERLDFGVGQGEWSDTRWIGGEVVVRFDLSLPAR